MPALLISLVLVGVVFLLARVAGRIAASRWRIDDKYFPYLIAGIVAFGLAGLVFLPHDDLGYILGVIDLLFFVGLILWGYTHREE